MLTLHDTKILDAHVAFPDNLVTKTSGSSLFCFGFTLSTEIQNGEILIFFKILKRQISLLTWQIRWNLRDLCSCKPVQSQSTRPTVLCTFVRTVEYEMWLYVQFLHAIVDSVTFFQHITEQHWTIQLRPSPHISKRALSILRFVFWLLLRKPYREWIDLPTIWENTLKIFLWLRQFDS